MISMNVHYKNYFNFAAYFKFFIVKCWEGQNHSDLCAYNGFKGQLWKLEGGCCSGHNWRVKVACTRMVRVNLEKKMGRFYTYVCGRNGKTVWEIEYRIWMIWQNQGWLLCISTTGWPVIFTRTENIRVIGENHTFCFGTFKFEMPVGYPSGIVR